MSNKRLRFGWFCPTNGDTTAFGDPSKAIAPSLEHYVNVAQSAEDAGFEYMLTPTNATCWDAWTTASFVAARTKRIKPLVAIKPGMMHPVATAKMIAAFNQFTGGRLCINLIAGLSGTEAAAEGMVESKEARYRQLDEEITLIKRLLTEKNVKFEGEFYHVNGPVVIPESPNGHPEIFLGGGSEQALDISVRHSSVHLFWGDYPSVIADEIKSISQRAAESGRRDALSFAMRLQIICRESEQEAWDFAYQLIEGADARKAQKQARDVTINSVANSRQIALGGVEGGMLTPHLWTGINQVRSGAGVAVVGTPKQVAAQLQEFVDAGCSGFCLSGYPHDKEAQIFGKYVMPLMV
jgi:alkanesulfonate monooxygenase